MKKLILAMAALTQLQTGGWTATKDFTHQERISSVQDGRRTCESERVTRYFRVEVIGDDGVKAESFRNEGPFIEARDGERYAVRLYNPLPVRVAVNLTVDGLNSIDGKPSGISDGTKWIVEANSFITIRGWQVNGSEDRRFFFTKKHASYARWRGKHMGKDWAANCGVIGAAYFWNTSELNAYLDAHPRYLSSANFPTHCQFKDMSEAKSVNGAGRQMLEDRETQWAAPQEKAGTGMGEHESNPTELVDFSYDAGMYQLDQAVVIYYDFAHSATPNPFPNVSYAPEMPLR